MPAKAKKPAQPGKKDEKGEAKKPQQEKKPENAPAKAKKEGAPKQASAPSKKKDPAPKPAAGAAGDAGKGKDKGKKRKLNETAQGKSKQGTAGTDSKKKKVEKKVQGKTGTAAQKAAVGKKPVKKQLGSKTKTLKRKIRRRRPARVGKQEIVVYEGRRYFLLPSGKMKAMLDIKLEENDKIAKVDGAFIRKSDVKAVEEFKESIKNNPAAAIKRKMKLKLQILRRTLMKDLLRDARVTNKQSLATAKDAGREVQVMTMFKGTWVRKKAVPRLLSFTRNKTIKIKAARKEKGTSELTEAEQKTLQKYIRKILQEENRKLRQALLSKRPSVAGKQKPAGKQQKKAKPAKKVAPAKGKDTSKKAGADNKKQKRPAKKEKAAN